MTEKFKGWLDQALHIDWLSTLITVVILVGITALIAHILTLFLRRILQSNKGPIPAVSIFINIGRIATWAIGISIILSSCFNVNVGAAVTALGVGGIAISLGFQDTLSNLIGGLQIIMTGLVEPGDRVKVNGFEGTVKDVTWRHTTITNVHGEHVIIPNSVINTQALTKLPPETDVRIEVFITEMDEPLNELVQSMQKEIDTAVGKVTVLETKSDISVTAKTDRGYKALVTLSTGTGVKKSVVVDTVMKAISNSAVKAHASHDENTKETPKHELKGRGPKNHA